MAPSQDPVVIIGGGPAGLTAAYELTRHGVLPLVLEQDARYVGGLARTVRFKDFRFDIGGHRFFSRSQEIERLWEEICGDDLIGRTRVSRIFYRGKFFNYPLAARNALGQLGAIESAVCIASYLRYRAAPIRPEVSFQDWVTNRFGRRLFEIFFRTYTEKVWGMPCHEISADWASQRIKGLSLRAAILRAVLPLGNHEGAPAIKTLATSFRYPRLGPGMMWERMRDRITEAGGQVSMGCDVIQVHHQGGLVHDVVVRRPDQTTERIPGRAFISSMPLRSLILRWTPSPPPDVIRAARGLKYRDFIVVGLVLRVRDPFPDHWVYVHDPTVRLGRVQNFRAWSPDMAPAAGRSGLGLEYFCNRGDPLWAMADRDLIVLAARELEQVKLARAADVEDGCVLRVPKAYPVYDNGYEARVGVIRDYLGGFRNIQPVGRNGMHKYNNQDHSMMTALLAARNILGADLDPWDVNADAQYLEASDDSRKHVVSSPDLGAWAREERQAPRTLSRCSAKRQA